MVRYMESTGERIPYLNLALRQSLLLLQLVVTNHFASREYDNTEGGVSSTKGVEPYVPYTRID